MTILVDFLSFLRFSVMKCESFRTFEIEHLNLERMNDSFTVRTSPKVGMILFGLFQFLEREFKMTSKEIIFR